MTKNRPIGIAFNSGGIGIDGEAKRIVGSADCKPCNGTRLSMVMNPSRYFPVPEPSVRNRDPSIGEIGIDEALECLGSVLPKALGLGNRRTDRAD